MGPADVTSSSLGPAKSPDLAALYRRSGPFVTVYFDPGTASEAGRRQAEVRWDEMVRQLEQLQVPRRAVDSMGAALSTVATLGRRADAACLVAADGEIVLAEAGPVPLARDLALVGPLPALGLVLEWRQHSIIYVTVRCDLAGADIIVHGPREDIPLTAGEQLADDPLLHKAHSGGSSYPRHERRVENTWDRNAKNVIEVLDRVVADARPRLVVFGGDPRACGLLRDEAGPALRPLLREVALGPATDGPPEHDRNAVHAAVEEVVAGDTATLLGRFQEMRARSFGVEGAGPVLGALTAGQVDVLLLHEEPNDERTAFISFDPVAAGPELDDLATLGARPVAARFVDVSLAMAFLTGGGARMVPEPPGEEGIAALLRFPV